MYNININQLNVLTKAIANSHPANCTAKKRLSNPHLLVAQTKKILSKANTSYGRYPKLLYDRQENYLSIQVTEPLLAKALRVFNTFINLAEERTHTVRLSDSHTVIKIDQIIFRIRLREQYKRVRVTDKPFDRYDYHPTGTLCFSLDELFKKEWTDKTKTLEMQVPRIMAYLELRAKGEIEWKVESAKRRAEYERKRLIEEEAKRKEAIEREKLDQLLTDSSNWRRAELIRNYVNESGVDQIHDNDWIMWALSKADEIDPTISKPK